MGRLLTIFAAIMTATLLLKGIAMAENAGYRYNIAISTKGSAWVLRVNDIYQTDNVEVAHDDASPNVSSILQTGSNTLSLYFSPVTGQDPEGGEYLYELRDGVEIDIAIKRWNWVDQIREELHVLRIRYDGETGEWVSLNKTFEGTTRVLATEHLRSNGQYSITELPGKDIDFLSAPVSTGGYRLDLEFTTDDYFPPFPWAEDSVVLEDTPQMRRELRAAYQRIYDMMERGNTEAVFQEIAPVWGRTAYLLTNFSSARELMEDEGRLYNLQARARDGSALLPLRIETDPLADRIQFMAENHLIRIYPAPLEWSSAPGETDIVRSVPVVFYKTREGQWHIGDVNTGY